MYHLLKVLLIAGVIVGFGSELAHAGRWRHERFERRMAELCVEAARPHLQAPPGTQSAAPEAPR